MTDDTIGAVEATCEVCGIVGWFSARFSHDGRLNQTSEGLKDPETASLCKDPAAIQRLQGSGQLHCPNLQAALQREIEAAARQ